MLVVCAGKVLGSVLAMSILIALLLPKLSRLLPFRGPLTFSFELFCSHLDLGARFAYVAVAITYLHQRRVLCAHIPSFHPSG